jgi:hypothetical protein
MAGFLLSMPVPPGPFIGGKKMAKTWQSLCLGIASALFCGIAAAGTYHVTVWNGLADCSGAATCLFDADQADAPAPSADPLAAFDFTSTDVGGGLNWAAAQGMFNTYGDFLDNGTIDNYSGQVSQSSFLSQLMSVEGNATASYFTITGIYTSPTAFTQSIMHDDGASLYVDSTDVFRAPGRVTGQVTSGPYSFDAGTHSFALYYVAADGGPAVLGFGLPGATVPVSVPEPASIALVGFGLLGLALVRTRRRS